MKQWKYYGVKLVHQAVISGEPDQTLLDEDFTQDATFYEESVLMVKAQSFEHAYTLAERHAQKNDDCYRNIYGQQVEWRLVEAIDCFLIGDELETVTEVYSSITPAPAMCTPKTYLEKQYEFDLEDDGVNQRREAERVRVQKLLRNGEF